MAGVQTDLHTHFAGVLSPDELVQLGLQHDISLDTPTAKKLGVVSEDFSAKSIPLKELSNNQMSLLKAGLALDPSKQSLFDELDDVYANRAFITKNPDMFVPQMEAIAKGYAEQGVKYTELSYAGIISNPELIRQIHEAAPRIEEETGVKLRFLAALWRHSDHEWNMDEADRLKKVMQSPYVVGMDVMGHEKNPIRDVKEPLQAITRHAAETVPGFTVRIHAGENPYYSADPSKIDDWNFNNTHEAVQIVHDARFNSDGSIAGPYADDIRVRVGHGRYGLHEETLKLMGQTGCIGELCLTSNSLLNHADNYRAPFELYKENGVNFVLSSDGYGMYHTSLPEELNKAMGAGMTTDAEALRNKTEGDILALDERRFKAKEATWEARATLLRERGIDPFDDLRNVEYSTPDEKPRWTPAVDAAKHEAIEAKRTNLLNGLTENGINTSEAEIERLIAEKQPIVFSGASKSSWENVPEEQRIQVEANLREFIGSIDSSKQVVITGGTDYGFEAVVHKLVAERNETLPVDKKIPVIGALTLEAQSTEIKADKISHAMVLQYGDGYAHSWMDQSPALLDMVQQNNGRVIMGGGGQVIRDMIVDAEGRGLIEGGKIALFENVQGASADKAIIHPEAAVSNAQDVKNIIASKLELSGDDLNRQLADKLNGEALQTTGRRPDVRLVIQNSGTEAVDIANPGGHSDQLSNIKPGEATMVMLQGNTLEAQQANAKLLDERYNLTRDGITPEFLRDLEGGALSEFVKEAYGPAPLEKQAKALESVVWNNDDGSKANIEPIKGQNAAYGARPPTQEQVFLVKIDGDTPATLQGTNTVAENFYTGADGANYIAVGVSPVLDDNWQPTGEFTTKPIAPDVAKEFYGDGFRDIPVLEIGDDGQIKHIDQNPRFKSINPDEYFDHARSEIAEKTVTINARPAIEGEEIVTVMKDGHVETSNKANAGDMVIKNPGGEEYIVPGDKFSKKYIETEQAGVYKPSGGPVKVMALDEDVKFTAPWGEEMSIKKGGVLVYNGPNDVYGIQPDEFKSTYGYSKDIEAAKLASHLKQPTPQQQQKGKALAADNMHFTKSSSANDADTATIKAHNNPDVIQARMSAGGSAAGVVMAGLGLKHAIDDGDWKGIAISGTDLAVSTADLALDARAALGGNVSNILRGGAAKANLAIMVADGIYQISREDELDNKLARGGALTLTTGAAMGVGSLAATVAGGGAVAASATVAAPIVAAVAVGITADAAVDAYKVTESLEDSIKAQEKVVKRSNDVEPSGAPKLDNFLNLKVFAVQEGAVPNGGDPNMSMREKAQFVKSHEYSNDPEALDDLEKRLKSKIAEYDKTIEENDSWVHDSVRFFWDNDEIDAKRQAQIDRTHYVSALKELEQYRDEVQDFKDAKWANNYDPQRLSDLKGTLNQSFDSAVASDMGQSPEVSRNYSIESTQKQVLAT